MRQKLEELIGLWVVIETFRADIRGRLDHRGTEYGFIAPQINVQFSVDEVERVDVFNGVITLRGS